MLLYQWILPVYTTVIQSQRIGMQPAHRADWLTALAHNGAFLFPYSVLYHYHYVLWKADMYIYSTWVTCLAGSH